MEENYNKPHVCVNVFFVCSYEDAGGNQYNVWRCVDCGDEQIYPVTH